MKTFYRRHLPHYQPPDGTYHVVFRLAGSLPIDVIERLKRERGEEEKYLAGCTDAKARREIFAAQRCRYFERFDALLEGSPAGPFWRREDAVAQVVADAIHHRDGRVYDLIAFTIMPNHVHLVVALVGRLAESTQKQSPATNGRDSVSTYRLTAILESLKKYTALRANRALGRHGRFWQHESYDHLLGQEKNSSRLSGTCCTTRSRPVWQHHGESGNGRM